MTVGNFGSQQIITTQGDKKTSVHAADVDGDGDMDVLSAERTRGKFEWYENDGSGNFGSQQVITTQAEGEARVYAADMDGDGDLDVLSSSLHDSKIYMVRK